MQIKIPTAQWLILAETTEFLAVYKPAMMNTTPVAAGDKTHLLALLEQAKGERYHIVYRLDKEVSGLVIFAKNPETQRLLNPPGETSLEKTYFAMVIGRPSQESGVIDLPLKEFGSGRVGVAPFGGSKAITAYELIRSYHGHSLLKITSLTDRRHQVRAHMHAAGHPLAGDRKYGDKALQQQYPRLMLHAFKVALPGLISDFMNITCNLPEDFRTVLRDYGIRNYAASLA